MKNAPGGISPPQLPAFAVIAGAADRGRIPLRPDSAVESGRRSRFSRAHLPAFARVPAPAIPRNFAHFPSIIYGNLSNFIDIFRNSISASEAPGSAIIPESPEFARTAIAGKCVVKSVRGAHICAHISSIIYGNSLNSNAPGRFAILHGFSPGPMTAIARRCALPAAAPSASSETLRSVRHAPARRVLRPRRVERSGRSFRSRLDWRNPERTIPCRDTSRARTRGIP